MTCYVCHNAIGVGAHENNGLQLANDSTLRASIDGPLETPAHGVAYGPYQDGDRRESSALCGSCHDVVTPAGAHIERTFAEYQQSLWAYDAEGKPTHSFWQAAPSHEHPTGFEALTLPFTVDPAVPHALSARNQIARHRELVRLTVRLRLRAIGHDVLNELVDAGDLPGEVAARMPTFTLHGASVEWRPSEAQLRSLVPLDLDCSSPRQSALVDVEKSVQ